MGVGAYVIRVADAVGTITLPGLEFDEQWLYEDQTARNLVWAKETDQAAAYSGGDQGGVDAGESLSRRPCMESNAPYNHDFREFASGRLRPGSTGPDHSFNVPTD